MVFPSREELISRLKRDREGLKVIVRGRLREKHLLLERFRGAIPSPRALLERRRGRYQLLRERFREGFAFYWNHRRQSLEGFSVRLSSLNPLSLLNRGYAIAYDEKGRVLRSAKTVEQGDEIAILLGEGKVFAQVKGKELEGER
jgi:exodeoxyribonuclease VII large subunit